MQSKYGQIAHYLSSTPTLVNGAEAGLLVDVNGNLLVSATITSLGATVFDLASADPLAVAIVDGTGAQITSFGASTQYATNVAYADGNTGTLALTVRDDALTTLTEADGDYSGLRVTSVGRLWTSTTIENASLAVTGTFWQATQAVSVASLPLPTGASTLAEQQSQTTHLATIAGDTTDIETAIESIVKIEDAGHSSGDKGVMMLGVLNDEWDTLADTEKDYIPFAMSETGELYVASQENTFFKVKLRDSNGNAIGSDNEGLKVSPQGKYGDVDDIGTPSSLAESIPYLFNGTTYDRLRGDITNGLDVDVTRLPGIQSGDGTISALNGSVIVPIRIGEQTVNFQVTGTWVATLSFEGSVDGGLTYSFLDVFSYDQSYIIVNDIAVNDRVIVNCAGFTHVRVIATAYTSGTASVSFATSWGAPVYDFTDHFEDLQHSTLDAGIFMLAVRNDSNTTRTNSDSDYSAISVDLAGNIRSVGNRDHDATDAGSPLKIGMKAYSPDGTTPGTAVAELDRTDAKGDLDGRLFTNDEHPRWWSYHVDGSSALTDASVAADPGDGFQVVITNICVSSGAATAMNLFLEEGSTKIFGPIYLEAVAGRGFCTPAGFKKHVTASTAVTVTTSAAIAHSVDIQGYIQAV